MDNADISEIVEGKLYLGSKDPAADLAALQRRGVTHVVNCTADGIEGAVPNHHERDGVLAYYRLPLLDGPKCSLLPLLPTALDWAMGAVEGGGVVFAHCHAGSSRSGAFVCAFLMATQQLSFADAWASARAKRPVVKPNAGFKAHLRAYQSMVDGVPPAPTPTEVELAVDAQEFADAEMMARMQRGEEWGEWTGYDEFKGAFAVALRRGETDWRQVEERLQDAEEEIKKFRQWSPWTQDNFGWGFIFGFLAALGLLWVLTCLWNTLSRLRASRKSTPLVAEPVGSASSTSSSDGSEETRSRVARARARARGLR